MTMTVAAASAAAPLPPPSTDLDVDTDTDDGYDKEPFFSATAGGASSISSSSISIAAATTASTVSTASTKSPTSKDITNLIHITNEYDVYNVQDDDILASDDSGTNSGDNNGGGRNARHVVKRLFGGGPNFCPIGNTNNEINMRDYVNDDDNDDNDNDKNDGSSSDDGSSDCGLGLRKVFDNSRKSVRGALDEHIVSKVGNASKSFQDVLDNKVTPHIQTARRKSIETITNIQKKSIDSFDDVKQMSMRTIGSVKDDTNKFVQNVKQSSNNTINTIQSQTNNIKPNIAKIIDNTHNGIVTKTEQCQSCIKSFIHDITITYRPYYWGTAPGLRNNNNNNNGKWYWLVLLQEGSLRAFSKVLFCDNPITGIFIWLGILYSSPLAGFCSMIGVLTVNSTALYFNMDNEKVRNGRYARNSVLIGPSIVDCFDFEFAFGTSTPSTWPMLIFFSIVLALVTLFIESIWIRESLLRRFRLWNTTITSTTPSLLLPYNFTLLVAFLCAKVWNYTMSNQIEFQNHYHDTNDDIDFGGIDTNINNTRFVVYRAVLNGLSRIFFVDGIVTGILILIGVGLCSRIIAISLICGSFVSSFVLGFLVFEESYDYLNYGYAGFNPALCTAGIFFYFVPSYKLIGLSLIVAIISTVIVSGSIDVLLRIMGIPVSTSIGFCLTLLPLLSMDLEAIFGQDHFIRRIPESQLSTPEDYLDSIRSLSSSSSPSLEEGSNDDNDDDDIADVVEKTTTMSEEDEVYGDYDDDIDEESGFIVTKSTSDSDGALPTNEETPLLSRK